MRGVAVRMGMWLGGSQAGYSPFIQTTVAVELQRTIICHGIGMWLGEYSAFDRSNQSICKASQPHPDTLYFVHLVPCCVIVLCARLIHIVLFRVQSF